MGILDRVFGHNRAKVERCLLCGAKMEIVHMVTFGPDAMPQVIDAFESAFQCGGCQRYTCLECSDRTRRCRCGSDDWRERLYRPIG